MRRNKYNARKVNRDGYVFDSQREANRYSELRVLERAGEIGALEVHPRYILQEAFDDAWGTHYRPIHYVGDFVYWENGDHIVEDVKGVETQVFKIKRKLFAKRYPNYKLIVTR